MPEEQARPARRYRVMVLAGTREARELCRQLAELHSLDVTASLAGVVRAPTRYPVPVISGGFGGVDGLVRRLLRDRTDLLVDATHPFADTIGTNSVLAAERCGVGIARLERPAWEAGACDDWLEFPSLARAVRAIPAGSRVFAPLGSSTMTPAVHDLLSARSDLEFVIRSIEPLGDTDIPDNVAARIVARPGIDRTSEIELLRRHGCTCLLCRNSGGQDGIPKLEAAASLKLRVFMVARPGTRVQPPENRIFDNPSDLAGWIRNQFM